MMNIFSDKVRAKPPVSSYPDPQSSAYDIWHTNHKNHMHSPNETSQSWRVRTNFPKLVSSRLVSFRLVPLLLVGKWGVLVKFI